MKNLIFCLLICFTTLIQAANIYVVQDKTIDKVLQYDGTLIPGNVIEILSPAKAIVTARHANFGDLVHQGDILFELSSPDLMATLAKEKMALFENSQALEKLKTWKSSTDVMQAEYNLNRAEQEYLHANSHFDQTKKLYEAGIVSKEEYLSDSRFNKDSLNHYLHAKQQLADMLLKGGEQFIQLAQMKVSQNQQQVKLLTDIEKRLSIKSPLTGVFLPPLRQDENKERWQLSYQKNTVQENDMLGMVADKDQLYVQIKIDEFDIVKIKKGQSAEISVLALSKEKIKGKISDINVMTNKGAQHNQAANFDVKIHLENLSDTLKDKILLGMSASVKLQVSSLKGILVPKEAVIYQNGETYVSLLEEQNKQKLQKISIGETSNDFVVCQGVKLGDKIVVQS